ncbi:DNA-directed RNA polymerase subunit P [archaeon]|nr:DNA-directed RNA polymerase subunit P [archaeon]|tara:strand:- start:232 stop:366 length:135 start_codon:yes stop_codon:yes gene_type:complete
MSSHVCLRCKEKIDMEEGSVKCPLCGFRITAKARPEFRKKVKAE